MTVVSQPKLFFSHIFEISLKNAIYWIIFALDFSIFNNMKNLSPLIYWNRTCSFKCDYLQNLAEGNHTWLNSRVMGDFSAKECLSNQRSPFEGCFTLFTLHSPLNKGASPSLKGEWTYARAYSPFWRENVLTLKGETPFLKGEQG